MMFDEEKFALRVKETRKKAGFTQEEVAKKVGYTTRAYKRWESGERTPYLADVVSLASALNVDVSTLIGEKNSSMGAAVEGKDLLDVLDIVNPKAAKSVVYEGIDEVIPGWNAYYKDYDQAIDYAWRAFQDVESKWCEDNSFLVMFDKDSKNIYAIRDFGMYRPTAGDFLFRSNFIPISTNQPEGRTQLIERVKSIDEKLTTEVEMMKKAFKKPVFLIRYCGSNNYIGWSLNENKPICIYDYKSYHDAFKISSVHEYDVKKIEVATDYGILPPSDDLVTELGLELFPDIWSDGAPRDNQKEIPKKEKLDCISPVYEERYDKWIALVNRGRMAHYSENQRFMLLEDRVERFEKLNELCAPEEIMEEVVKLVEKTAVEVNEMLIRNIIFAGTWSV